jgi:DNA-binding MarR family transcriptional regulator
LLSSKQRRRRPSGDASRVEPPDRAPSPVVVRKNRLSRIDIDYELLARFRYELRRFQAFSQAAAESNGLTPQQHQALLTIKGLSAQAPISVGALAKFLFIRHHTAVELVDRMTKLKFITRTVDIADGRRVFLKLTNEGEARLLKLSKIHFEELRAISPALAKILKSFPRSATHQPS